jgi:TM2 domain-containing membrane protein YozV
MNAMSLGPGNSGKSFISTLLLCLLVGFLGVHRFYVGKTRSGILMLLTFGGLGIWQLIDLIIIATQNFKDSEGLPIKA